MQVTRERGLHAYKSENSHWAKVVVLPGELAYTLIAVPVTIRTFILGRKS